MRRFWADFSGQAAMQGIIITLVGYASSVAIVIQGLRAMGATSAQITSALVLLGLAKGGLAIGLSLWTRMPISIAWSTPGMVLLAVTPALAGGFPAVIGAFIVTGLLIMLTALWSPLGRFIQAIPKPIANAMLAGILFKLCLAPFVALKQMPLVAGAVLLVWVVMLKVNRLFAVPVAIAVAVAAIVWMGGYTSAGGTIWPSVTWTAPVFTLDAIISIALPLFVVTMASQNITGLAVLSTFNFHPDPRQGLLATGAVSALTAPFGAATVNYSAITAAMCAGPEAHPDPARRYVAAVVAGAGYAFMAVFAAVATSFVVGSSPILIEAVAGLALIGSFAAATSASLQVEDDRLPAMATLLVTASGVSIYGIGPAFWGLVIGWGLYAFLKPKA